MPKIQEPKEVCKFCGHFAALVCRTLKDFNERSKFDPRCKKKVISERQEDPVG